MLQRFMITVALLASVTSFGQTVPDSAYYHRLFYLCKAWGHCKYYHTAIAAGTVNWDAELIMAIRGCRSTPMAMAYADTVLRMIIHAGPMETSSVPMPAIPDSLNNNKDLSWMGTALFSDSVRSRLDTIWHRFRPQENVYAGDPANFIPSFNRDTLYCKLNGSLSEEQRLLALFRYWNIIHYFYPYKNVIGRPWDSTLTEFIPRLAAAQDELTYNLTMKELTTRINDTHASFSSPVYLAWRGNFYPPFLVRFIENEMVVTKVLPGNSEIKPGDVIRNIDDQDLYTLRNELRKYAHGSNEVSVERILNSIIMYGDSGNFNIRVENQEGLHQLILARNGTNYVALNAGTGAAWRDTVLGSSCHVGIVDMGKLKYEDIGPMFAHLWNTDFILFDIRNYPNGTLWYLMNYLFPEPVHMSNFTIPDVTIPGSLFWKEQWMGMGSDSNYLGKITILADERTISQAEYTCMGFEQFGRTLKVGSTTAAADGGNQYIYLPGNIVTNASMQGVYYPDYRPTQRIGIIPDFEVHPTISGIRSGYDEVMSFALTCTLGTEPEPEKTEILTLYPNPASVSLNFIIYSSNPGTMVNIWITNVYGKEVWSGVNQSSEGILDVSGLAPGCYILRFYTGKETIIRKFMKL